MSNEQAQTPPEKCPVCGAGPKRSFPSDEHRSYKCGAVWLADERPRYWYIDCPHAMTAALRCHATLEPTPLETARAALVDAAVVIAHAFPATRDFPENDDAYATLTNAQIELDRLAEAYAALLEPAP